MLPALTRWQSANSSAPPASHSRPEGRDRQGLRGGLRGAEPAGLALGLAIIGWQSIQVSDSFSRAWNSPLWIVPHAAWPAIFILCGYILARGADVESKQSILGRLITRAVLPLIFTILGTAFLLGPAVTTSSISNYFADVDLRNYLLNLIAWPQFTLPGVFEFNHLATIVNEPLWAVPCLLLTTLVAVSGRGSSSRRRLAAGAAVGALIGIGLLSRFDLLDVDDPIAAVVLAVALAGQLGILAYEFQGNLRIGRIAIAVSLAGLAVLAYLGRGGSMTDPASLQLVTLLAFGPALSIASWRLPLEKTGSVAVPYLGGALLLAFPIQQVVVLWRSAPQGPFGNFLLSLPVAGVTSVAMLWLSRRLVGMIQPTAIDELPALDLRNWKAPALGYFVRARRRALPPLFLLFSALILGTLAVLAMTLFALQRNPWEN